MLGYRPNRREMIVGASLALTVPLFASAREGGPAPAIVSTSDGKLKGLRHSAGFVFKGIPYAADTGGKNRFLAPQPVAKWRGIRDAFNFGDRAPQPTPSSAETALAGGQAPTYSENCCVLNLYTPSLDAKARLPVLVYIHGGGFRSGSGDTPTVAGDRLASHGNVVITLNRRLNIFGFAALGSLDPAFADASCAGQLDILAALRWIKTNVAQFGGDPGRVTLFGVSGGGSSIEVLSLMPAAQGLFHRAINMSGSSAFAMRPASDMVPVADSFLQNLGLKKGDVRKLQELPHAQLLAAYGAALKTHHAGDYRPVIDGKHIPYGPLTPGALAIGAARPTIMTSTATEASVWLAADKRNISVTREQLVRRVGTQFDLEAGEAAAIVEAYGTSDPRRTPWDILVAIGSDALVRKPLIRAAEIRAEAAVAPVYLGEFNWRSPVDGGAWGAAHAMDVAFAFGTLDSGRLTANAGPGAERVAEAEMASFSAFARTGSPNNPRMPDWKPFDRKDRSVMVIDDPCRVVEDYRARDRKAAAMVPTQDAFAITGGPLFRFDG